MCAWFWIKLGEKDVRLEKFIEQKHSEYFMAIDQAVMENENQEIKLISTYWNLICLSL